MGTGDWTWPYWDSPSIWFSSLLALVLFAYWSFFFFKAEREISPHGGQNSYWHSSSAITQEKDSFLSEMDSHWTCWVSSTQDQSSLPKRWVLWIAWSPTHTQSLGQQARVIPKVREDGNQQLSLCTMATHHLGDLEQHTWTLCPTSPSSNANNNVSLWDRFSITWDIACEIPNTVTNIQ